MTLVIIPSLMHKYSFSAPLAWFFGRHAHCVQGVYSYALSAAIVKKYDRFIVELNWFIEYYEFSLIVAFIKRHNPDAVILFGGLHAQLTFREVFQRLPVDYYIKGDCELPIQLFVEGNDPQSIPNMVGRDFENPQTYVFQQKDYADLEFNLDWFPDYLEKWAEFPGPGADVDVDFSRMPLLPKYWNDNDQHLPLNLRWRVPPKGGRYHLPMLITARGSCLAVHNGCEYCMGARCNSEATYLRPPLVLDNETAIVLLRKIEQRFSMVTLYINSDCCYDFSGHSFNLDATIEVDSRCTVQDIARIMPAFKKACMHLSIYNEGLTGSSVRNDLQQFSRLEDMDHKIYYFASDPQAGPLEIPADRRLFAELICPPWTHWDFYNNSRKALARSMNWYFSTGQVNLYPVPRQKIIGIFRFIFLRLAYVLHRLNIVDLKKKHVV